MRTLVVLLLAATSAAAQTSFPMLTHAAPTAVRRGDTVTVVVESQTPVGDPTAVLFDGRGVSATAAVGPKTPKTLTLAVRAAADAPLGVREFRVGTSLGLSSLGQLLVVDDPVVTETPGRPTALPVPGVACGNVSAGEEIDVYTFRAAKGHVVTFEVFAARLQDKIHDLQKHIDPLLTITDAAGRELAANDDAHFADPVLAFRPPATGEYRLLVRDAKYDGDPRWVYAVTATDRPYPEAVFPLGVPAGQRVCVVPVLLGSTARPMWPLVVPTEPGVHAVAVEVDGKPAGPVPVVATDLPTVFEQEPNDAPATATPLDLPCGANGRIGKPRDTDYYRFRAKKGQAVAFEVFARRFGTPLRSPLDATLDVLTADGKVLASNDDANGKDPAVAFAPPADGEYLVRVRDLHGKGGDAFVYFLAGRAARPDFALKCDPSKAMIGPGSRTAWFVQVSRTTGFAEPVTVTVEGLPAGVTASPLTIPPGMTQGLVVLSADIDAKPTATAVRVVGTAGDLRRVAVPVEEIYLPGGGRGRFDVGLHAVAVTGPSDIREVTVSQTRVTLAPGQEVTLDVELVRGPGFDKPVTLDVPLRHLGQVFASPLPPGVTVVEGKSKTLLGGGSRGTVVLAAAADAAACADVPVCVQAFVAVNFVVKVGYASAAVWLTVSR